jgi:predicted PurR-regulated permease PerM
MDRYGGVPNRNLPLNAAQTRLPTLAAMAGVIAVFYFAKDVFLPLAIAILLTFMLAPIVAFLRRFGLPRLVAIITSVAGGFLIIAVFSAILAFQISRTFPASIRSRKESRFWSRYSRVEAPLKHWKVS